MFDILLCRYYAAWLILFEMFDAFLINSHISRFFQTSFSEKKTKIEYITMKIVVHVFEDMV